MADYSEELREVLILYRSVNGVEPRDHEKEKNNYR